jgi:hypothetical protein
MKDDREINKLYMSGAKVHRSDVKIDLAFMKIHWGRNKIYRSGAKIDRADAKIN